MPDQRTTGRDRIEVVAVDDEHVLRPDERLGGGDGIRRAAGRLLNRELDGEPPRPQPRVVRPDDIVRRPDHDAHARDAAVGEVVQQVVEKRALEGDHRLQARVGDRGLPGRERGRVGGRAHPRAEACRQNDRSRDRGHAGCWLVLASPAQSVRTTHTTVSPLTMVITRSTVAVPIRPYR